MKEAVQMKIGLAGGVANSHYQVCKWLNKLGYKGFYVYRQENSFASSHPIWEEKELVMKYEDFMCSNQSPNYFWESLIKKLNFVAPSWCINIDEIDAKGMRKECKGLWGAVYYWYEKKHLYLSKMRAILSEADFLILGNMLPEIVGYFTGKPYIIWPSGGDMRLAAGSEPSKNLSLKNYALRFFYKKLLRQSFENALFIASHNPMGMGALKGTEKLPLKGFKYFPFPLEADPPNNMKQKKERLYLLSSKLNFSLPEEIWESIVLFVPSRLDFYWKGIDKFLKAFLRLKSNKLYLICSGWGNDRAKAMEMFQDSGREKYVNFLNFALSKPLLLEMFRAVDLVVDQFVLGAYGTAALEAMSVGTPVMMWIDEEAFKEQGFSVPPVLNAKIEEDIERLLQKLASEEIDMGTYAFQSYRWIEDIHDYRKVLPKLMSQIEDELDKFKRHPSSEERKNE